MKTFLKAVVFSILLAVCLLAVQASTSFAHNSPTQTSVQKIDQQKVFDSYSSCESRGIDFAPVPGGGGAQPDSGCHATGNCCAWGDCSQTRFCCSYHYCASWILLPPPFNLHCTEWATGYDCYCSPNVPQSDPDAS